MKKLWFISFLCFLITGCPGGNALPKIRPTFINGNNVCLTIDKNDTLNYYTIYSSEFNEINTVTGSGIGILNNHYPDTCLKIKWRKNHTYVIYYGLNNKKYVHRFSFDNNGKIINSGEF